MSTRDISAVAPAGRCTRSYPASSPTMGYRIALGGIALPNDASVGLHEACGFKLVGVYRGIGFKHGTWWDVGWWQLDLASNAGDGQPPEPGPGSR